jgi:outer membrane autotransporter protein
MYLFNHSSILVGQTIQIGGGAGGSTGGNGIGGAGGAGTLSVDGTSSAGIDNGGSLILGGSGNTGGAGVFNLAGALNFGAGGTFIINGNNAGFGAGILNIVDDAAINPGGDNSTNATITGLDSSGITNYGSINFRQSNTFSLSAPIRGVIGYVTQSGSGKTILTGTGSSVARVDVTAGTLEFSGTGVFTVGGVYTNSAATTLNNDAQLNVGTFSQNAGATLNVAIGGVQPAITAQGATINGNLNITGLLDNSGVVRASDVINSLNIIIHTTGSVTNGITGNFQTVTMDGVSNALNFLRTTAARSANGNDYLVSFGLTWYNSPTSTAHGTFTLPGSLTFDVDVPLVDRINDGSGFANGWDGRTLTKQGTGTLILSALNTYTGGTDVNEGTLQAGAVNAFSPNSSVTVAPAGTLDLAGFSQTVAGLANGGVVNMGTDTAPGTVLTVTGAYVSNSGSLRINTALGNDDSPTDLLRVGSTVMGTGATTVSVTNVGGLGARTTGDGIEIVQVTGGPSQSAPGVFQLNGRVAAGAYDYLLYQGGIGADAGDGNWYLRSVNGAGAAVRAEVEAAMAGQALAANVGLTMLGTYQGTEGERCVGELRRVREDGRCEGTVWGRVIADFGAFSNDGRFSDSGPSYDYSLGGLQVGVDLFRNLSSTGGFYAGAATTSGDLSNLLITRNGESMLTSGKAGVKGYSLGGYWTHHEVSRWYADAVVQGTRYNQVRSSVVGGESSSTRGYDIATSLEAGVPLVSGDRYTVEPQAQLVYQHLHLNDAGDAIGHFLYGDTDALYGRIGGRILRSSADNAEAFTTWVRANLWHIFTGLPEMTVTTLEGMDPQTFTGSPTLGHTWGQFGVGASGQAARNLNLFATLDYNPSFGPGSGYSVDGRLGMRISW